MIHITHFEILFYALALAFSWVYYARPALPTSTNKKPLNCLKCMTGWFALFLALVSGNYITAVLFLAAGVFVGAMVEGIMMRYL